MPLSIGEGPDGKLKVVAVDEDGRVQVDAEISTSAGPIEVVIADQQTATALPEPGTSGLVTHVVPTGPQEPEQSLAVVISNQELQIAGTTTIATRARGATSAGNPTSRVIDSDVRALDVTAVGGATEAKQDDGNTSLSTLVANAVVSDYNSTMTPLGAGASFVGEWEDALQYVEARVSITVDVASAGDGLVIEQSQDGITVDSTDTYTIAAGSRTFVAQRAARYMRVRYTNGTTPQAVCRLQTILNRTPGVPSAHNVSRDINGEDDAQLTLAVLTARQPGSDTWGSARIDQYHRLLVVTAAESSPEHGPPNGQIDVPTTAETLIVSPPYTEQSTGAQRSFVSTSAQDGPGGTGIRSVVLEYFDASVNGPYQETVTLNGLTPVNTVATNICFIERMHGVTAGSPTAVAAGNIELKAGTGGAGVTIWSIASGMRGTRGAHHYCQPGADIHVTALIAGVNGTGAASVYLLFGEVLTPNYMFRRVSPVARVSQDGQAVIPFDNPINIDGPGRLVVAVKRDTASSTLTYFGGFGYYRNAEL